MRIGEIVEKISHKGKPLNGPPPIGIVFEKYSKATGVAWFMSHINGRDWTIEWDYDLRLVQRAEAGDADTEG